MLEGPQAWAEFEMSAFAFSAPNSWNHLQHAPKINTKYGPFTHAAHSTALVWFLALGLVAARYTRRSAFFFSEQLAQVVPLKVSNLLSLSPLSLVTAAGDHGRSLGLSGKPCYPE